MSVVRMATNSVPVGGKTAYLCRTCSNGLRSQHPEVRQDSLNSAAKNRRPCDLCTKH